MGNVVILAGDFGVHYLRLQCPLTVRLEVIFDLLCYFQFNLIFLVCEKVEKKTVYWDDKILSNFA